jgi:hypothetical protein
MVPMERWSALTVTGGFRARLRGGPEDGRAVELEALADGEPPDCFAATDDESGMYVRAGLPNLDGSMPYWWIPATSSLISPVDPDTATWTLVSLGDDGETRMWHQHGENAEPVPLIVEPVESVEVPVQVGRAYSCPACPDMTVLSRPASPAHVEAGSRIRSASRHLN